MKHIASYIKAMAILACMCIPYAIADDNEEPVSIAVQGAGIDAVVDVPADRAGTGPHVKRKEASKQSTDKPENIKIRGTATETIEYGTDKQIGNVRVRIPKTR